MLFENSLLFNTSILFATSANSIYGLVPAAGGIFFHLYINIPVTIISTPGLHASTKVFSNMIQMDLGMRPGFNVLKVSCTFIS